MDDNVQAQIIYDSRQLDGFTLLTTVQWLGHLIELINSETVQVQLRIEDM